MYYRINRTHLSLMNQAIDSLFRILVPMSGKHNCTSKIIALTKLLSKKGTDGNHMDLSGIAPHGVNQ